MWRRENQCSKWQVGPATAVNTTTLSETYILEQLRIMVIVSARETGGSTTTRNSSLTNLIIAIVLVTMPPENKSNWHPTHSTLFRTMITGWEVDAHTFTPIIEIISITLILKAREVVAQAMEEATEEAMDYVHTLIQIIEIINGNTKLIRRFMSVQVQPILRIPNRLW